MLLRFRFYVSYFMFFEFYWAVLEEELLWDWNVKS